MTRPTLVLIDGHALAYRMLSDQMRSVIDELDDDGHEGDRDDRQEDAPAGPADPPLKTSRQRYSSSPGGASKTCLAARTRCCGSMG